MVPSSTPPSEAEMFLDMDEPASMPVQLDSSFETIQFLSEQTIGPEMLATHLLLTACKQYGKWCGVNIRYLKKLLQIMNNEQAEADKLLHETSRDFYPLFETRPVIPLVFHAHATCSPEMLIRGIQILVSKHKATVRELPDMSRYIFPSALLLSNLGQMIETNHRFKN
jgi:hypothetical protein